VSEPLREVGPGTWLLALGVPSSKVVSATNCYILEGGDGSLHLLDPGWDTPENEAAIVDALRELGGRLEDVADVIVSHLHVDHLGLARRLGAERGLGLVMHRAEHRAAATPDERFLPERLERRLARWGVPGGVAETMVAELRLRYEPQPRIPSTSTVEDGELLPVPGRDIRALLTPGHTTGHICLHDESNDLLFSGDAVLPRITPGVGLGGPSPTNPLLDAMASLALVSRLQSHCLPGHGEPFDGIGERCAEIVARYDARTEQVGALLEQDPAASAWEVASQLSWSGGWASLPAYLRRSALSQVAMHAARVRGTDPIEEEWEWA